MTGLEQSISSSSITGVRTRRMLSLPDGRREEVGEDNRFILMGGVVIVDTLGGGAVAAGDGGDDVAGFFNGVLDEQEDEEGDPEVSDSTKKVFIYQ